MEARRGYSDSPHIIIWLVAETFLLLENLILWVFCLPQLLSKEGEHCICFAWKLSGPDKQVTRRSTLYRKRSHFVKQTIVEISAAEPPVLEMESIAKNMSSTLRVN